MPEKKDKQWEKICKEFKGKPLSDLGDPKVVAKIKNSVRKNIEKNRRKPKSILLLFRVVRAS